MGIKSDLNIKAQEIIQIIIRIHHFYDELKYLNSTIDTRELFFIKRNKFFHFSKVSLLICTILDLNTLYSTDDKYSLIKFLNTAKNRYTALNWSDKISKDTIDKWLETIIRQDQIIKKIKTLRNKHYAHIEFDQSGIKKTMPTYDEFETLITLASSIM